MKTMKTDKSDNITNKNDKHTNEDKEHNAQHEPGTAKSTHPDNNKQGQENHFLQKIK